MTSYTKNALYLICITGTLMFGVSCFVPEWKKFGLLACSTGMVSFITLLAERLIRKSQPKSHKKRSREITDTHIEPALDIIYGRDDGRRHYKNLTPEQRQKSIFGEKNI